MCVSCFERKDCFIFWDDLKGLQIICCNRFLQIIAFLIGWLSDDIIYSALVSSLVCFQSESTPSFEALVRGWLRTHSTICCRRPSRLGLSSTQPWTIHWHVETSFPSLFHSMSENLSNLCPAWTCRLMNFDGKTMKIISVTLQIHPDTTTVSALHLLQFHLHLFGNLRRWRSTLNVNLLGDPQCGHVYLWAPEAEIILHPSSFIVHRSSSNCPSFLWKSCPSASARWSTARS